MGFRTLPVRRLARRDFVSVGPKERLDFADRVFELGRFRHLPVVEDGRLLGILSTRDVREAALSKMLSFDPAERRTFLHSVDVGEVMVHRVVTIAPDRPLEDAARRMLTAKIGCLPVVEADGTLVGLLTESDLLRAAYLDRPDGEA